jgi:hypothetical protein
MAFTAPSISDLFGGIAEGQRLDRFEAFKSALTTSYEKTARGEVSWNGSQIVKSATVSDRLAELRASVSKGLSADQVSQVESALNQVSDINKDWSLSNPLNSVPYGNMGLVPYDVDAALALLVPRSFILRNSIPRIGGVGQAYEFRRILGVTNSNTGGVANMSTFFSPTGNTTTFGGVSLNRPAKINYAADREVLSYKNQGVSDSVDMTAQFAGQGFADLRQLSHTSAVWAHMLGEERNMANARSTALVFGAGTPVAAAESGVTTSGLPAGTTVPVIVTPVSSMGEGKGVAAGNVTITAGQGIKLTTVPAINAGTLGIAFYVTIATVVYRGFTVRNDGTSPTTFVAVAAAPSTSVDNGSFNAQAYDGFVTTLTSADSGYVKHLNAAFITSEPGAEFQDAFASLFSSVIGDPDTILTTAAIRRSLAKSLQSGTSNGYRLNYETGSDGVTVGSVITAVQNESTGKMVDVVAHPYLPAGVALIHSSQLPFPDSGVAATVQAVNVQDLAILEWPQIQMSWDLSTYQYGTLAFRAPGWSGAITNIITA